MELFIYSFTQIWFPTVTGKQFIQNKCVGFAITALLQSYNEEFMFKCAETPAKLLFGLGQIFLFSFSFGVVFKTRCLVAVESPKSNVLPPIWASLRFPVFWLYVVIPATSSLCGICDLKLLVSYISY